MNITINIIEQSTWSLLMLKITCIGSIKEVNDKDLKFKVCDHVRTPKYKNFLRKDILQIVLKEFL